MFQKIIFLMVGIALTACSSTTISVPTQLPAAISTLAPTATSTAATNTVTPTPTETAPPTAATNLVTNPSETPVPTESSALIAPAPTFTLTRAATPVPLTRTGWKTFLSAVGHVALDYPADWSVEVRESDVVFTSPRGEIIQLAFQATADDEDLPNTRCSSNVNEYGVRVRLCFDTIAASHIASLQFTLPSGSTQSLTLVSGRKGNAQVFETMVSSARPAQ